MQVCTSGYFTFVPGGEVLLLLVAWFSLQPAIPAGARFYSGLNKTPAKKKAKHTRARDKVGLSLVPLTYLFTLLYETRLPTRYFQPLFAC